MRTNLAADDDGVQCIDGQDLTEEITERLVVLILHPTELHLVLELEHRPQCRASTQAIHAQREHVQVFPECQLQLELLILGVTDHLSIVKCLGESSFRFPSR